MFTQKRSWIMPTLMSVVVLAIAGGALSMLNTQTDKVTHERGTLAQLQEDLVNLDAIIVDEKTFAVSMARVRQTLPMGYTEVSRGVATIEQVAKSSGISLDLRIDDTAKPESNGLKSIGITMQTSGSFSATASFFHAIATLPFHTQVDTLAIEGAGGKVAGTVVMRLFIGK